MFFVEKKVIENISKSAEKYKNIVFELPTVCYFL